MRKAKLAGLAASMIGILAGAFGAGTASATYLEVGGEAKQESVTFKATLEPETTTRIADTGLTNFVTCTQSELHAKTGKPFIGKTVTGAVSAMSFAGNCDVKVHKMGILHFEHIENSTDAIVRSSEIEITVFILGMYQTCKTYAGFDLGRLIGVKEGHTTFQVNTLLNCGFALPSMVWQANYKVTSPTGLGASSEDTTLEVGGSAKAESISLEASAKPESLTTVKSTAGELLNTCTGSVIKTSTTAPYSDDEVHGKLSSWTWSGCSFTQGTFIPGKLSVVHVPGTTNGTVISSEAWFVFKSALGSHSCNTKNTAMGTLTGVKEGHATVDIDAVLDCGSLAPSVRWEGTYAVTSPTGLGVTS